MKDSHFFLNYLIFWQQGDSYTRGRSALLSRSSLSTQDCVSFYTGSREKDEGTGQFKQWDKKRERKMRKVTLQLH